MRWKVWVPCLAAVLAAGVVVVLVLPREDARAGSSAEFGRSTDSDLVDFIRSGVSLNRRLLAVEVLRQREGGLEALVGLARGPDPVIAVFCCAALGRKKSSDARSALRDLVVDGDLGAEVRTAAMSVLASRFRNESDLEWLETKVGSNSALKGQLVWLKSKVFGK